MTVEVKGQSSVINYQSLRLQGSNAGVSQLGYNCKVPNINN